MHERRTPVLILLSLLARQHIERSLRRLAREVSQERASQESAEQDRRPGVRGDGDESAQDQDHEDDVQHVVVHVEPRLDELAENGREEPLGQDGRKDGHERGC